MPRLPSFSMDPFDLAIAIRAMIPEKHDVIVNKLHGLIRSFQYSAPELQTYNFGLLDEFLCFYLKPYQGEQWENRIREFIKESCYLIK
jgi:hypothetical protein